MTIALYTQSTWGGDGATLPLPRRGDVEEQLGDPKVGPNPKVCTRNHRWKLSRKWGAEEVQMRNNPRGELGFDDRRRCKKNFPSVLSCIQ